MQLVSKAITGKAKQNDTAPSSQLVGFNGFGQTLNLCSGHFHTLLVILSYRRVQLHEHVHADLYKTSKPARTQMYFLHGTIHYNCDS